MRALVLAAALLASAAVVPSAQAAHDGPCTHEYFEIAEYVAETGDVRNGVRYAGYCVTGTLVWACNVLRCRELIA